LIAFCSNRENKLEVYTISADGKKLSRVTDTSYESGLPNWSADGKFLVYHKVIKPGLLKLFIRSLRSGSEKQITIANSVDYSPSWSSGNSIAFNSRTDPDDLNHHINVLFLNKNKLVTVTDTKFDYSAPCISYNGRQIVCIRTTAMTKPFKETTADELKKIRSSSEIIIMNVDGTGIRNISKDTLINRSPGFSRSGKHIYYLCQTDSGAVVKMYIMDSGLTKDVLKPTGIVNSFSISPDEKKIVYSSVRNKNYGIYVWDLKTRSEKLIIGK
jgi:Tol biopolymer transport system component